MILVHTVKQHTNKNSRTNFLIIFLGRGGGGVLKYGAECLKSCYSPHIILFYIYTLRTVQVINIYIYMTQLL